MAKIVEKATIEYETGIVLSEAETKALSKVLEWGAEAAVDGMLKGCSDSETKPHRDTLIKLFSKLRDELPRVVALGTDARSVFAGRMKAVALPKPGSN